jgi:pimeloyl-ACP methyl ester carboxylesterase
MPTRAVPRLHIAKSSLTGLGEATVIRRDVRLHGQRISFLETGADSGGPVVVLLHGMAASSSTWRPVLPLLGRHAHVIAPDLLGHGQSAKPRSGDYTLGAYACGLRDLLLELDVERATVVGHSFGGGVGMQFAYQFPELTGRLVLASSGGLGPEVNIALRAASLPGTAFVLQGLTAMAPSWAGRLAGQALRAAPMVPGIDVDVLAHSLASLAAPGAVAAFVQTIRGVLDWSGQRLDGTDRLYLLADIPVLLIGGSDDSYIPTRHTIEAHRALPTSRLEIFDGAGHFPHTSHPQRFADTVLDFLATTAPARADRASLRRQLRACALTGPVDDDFPPRSAVE